MNILICLFLVRSAIHGNFTFHGTITYCQGTPQLRFTSWLTENGKQQFEGATRNALNLGTNNDRLDVLIEKMPDEVDYGKRNIPNITKDTMRKIRGTGMGYYTFRFNHLFGNADEVFVCRQERLRADLIQFLERIGAATDAIRAHILESDKQNTASHSHYSSYYTPELAELVSIRDREVLERFGYTFESAPTPQYQHESLD